MKEVVSCPLIQVLLTWQGQQHHTVQHSTGDNTSIRGISIVVLALLATELARCCPFTITDHQGEKQSKSPGIQEDSERVRKDEVLGKRTNRFEILALCDIIFLHIPVKLELQKKTQVYEAH